MNPNGSSSARFIGRVQGGKKARTPWPHGEVPVDPNELIDSIVDALDYAEIAKDSQGLIKARRLLNNDLRQAIDVYVQGEVSKALDRGMLASQ